MRPGDSVDPAVRLRATLDSLLDPHVVLTAVRDASGEIVDFEYTDANTAACEYNGLTYAQLIGSRLLDLLPGHLSTGLMEQYRTVIETGVPLVLDDYVYALEPSWRRGEALRHPRRRARGQHRVHLAGRHRPAGTDPGA